jgi:hypothetical protein
MKAILDRVTITGADDSIQATDLIGLTEEFPFVEWGILVSQSSTGQPRFPSGHWLTGLSLLTRVPHQLPLALHVCGKWTRQALLGIDGLPDGLLQGYARVQLNFHAERTKCDPARFAAVLRMWREHHYVKQVIFQLDGQLGNKHMAAVQAEFDPDFDYVQCVPLFDTSGGAGVLPQEWPQPYEYDHMEELEYHGYAGGLGPDNLEEQLPRIMEAASNPKPIELDGLGEPHCGSSPCRIWIDMETKVRSKGDCQFDLAKVRRCLEIAAPYVTLKASS